ARAQLMPWVSADAAAEVEDVRRTSDLSHAQTRRTGLWALTLTQPVVDIGRWDQLKQSHYIARTGDVALEQARQDLILRVAESYFDVLAAQDTLDTILAQKEAVSLQLQ